MTIKDTDTWETWPCGCRLQLNIWTHDGSDDPPLNMWVIREECAEHEARSVALQNALAKFGAGGPLTMDDEATLGNVRYVDLPLEDQE